MIHRLISAALLMTSFSLWAKSEADPLQNFLSAVEAYQKASLFCPYVAAPESLDDYIARLSKGNTRKIEKLLAATQKAQQQLLDTDKLEEKAAKDPTRYAQIIKVVSPIFAQFVSERPVAFVCSVQDDYLQLQQVASGFAKLSPKTRSAVWKAYRRLAQSTGSRVSSSSEFFLLMGVLALSLNQADFDVSEELKKEVASYLQQVNQRAKALKPEIEEKLMALPKEERLKGHLLRDKLFSDALVPYTKQMNSLFDRIKTR